MRKCLFLFSSLLVPLILNAQFEQKASINLSIGSFKTFGYEMGEFDYDPLQMPHYKPGIMAEAGIQYNISRHFSVMANVGMMYSGSWSYLIGEYDYLHYIITDPLTEEVLAEGYNELNFFNFDIGIYPKYYLFAGKKWTPYFFAGVNINFTHANFTDNWWKDANKLGVLPADDTGPYDPFLENNAGIGLVPGIGIEYGPTDKFAFYLSAGYYLIPLNEKNFKSEYVIENFNAFFLQAGIRFSFIKSKNL